MHKFEEDSDNTFISIFVPQNNVLATFLTKSHYFCGMHDIKTHFLLVISFEIENIMSINQSKECSQKYYPGSHIGCPRIL